jgi:hypothetical protein
VSEPGQDAAGTDPARPGDTPDATPTVSATRVVAATVAAVVVVLGAALVTGLLPADLQQIVFRTPLLIVVLVVGTGGLLLWLATRPRSRA